MAAEPRDALDAAARSRVTVVIGESDTGKTSLVAALANALFSRDATVAIVDADIGQSEIGPPTTVGLGRVTRQLGRPADAEVVVLRFVGATSAARDLRATVQATGQLVDRARALGFERAPTGCACCDCRPSRRRAGARRPSGDGIAIRRSPRTSPARQTSCSICRAWRSGARRCSSARRCRRASCGESKRRWAVKFSGANGGDAR